ncbi:tetratricopeptide repeat protein [Candidatus Zixiibacteriota bacterium]
MKTAGRFFFSWTRARMLTALTIVISLLLIVACAKEESSSLAKGLSLYQQNKLQEALPLLREAVEQDKQNPDANAWLAETYRRVQRNDDAIIVARQVLKIDPCHSFANTILAAAYNPLYRSWKGASFDTAWHYLQKAAECNPDDGNVWTGIWVEATRRGEKQMRKEAARRMYQSGFFTPALLAYNRWMLRHLPQNALLLTNGDMDTYPAVALQEVEGFRPDVVVANLSLLNTKWYARHLRDDLGIPLPLDDDRLDALAPLMDADGKFKTISTQLVSGWLKQRQAGEFPRSITISVTVGNKLFASGTESHLSLFGAFYSWFPVPAASAQDTSMLRISLAGIDPEEFSGPLVSEQDTSPVRRVSTNHLVKNITAAALTYSEKLIEAGRTRKAKEMLDWAEQFEKKTENGPVFTERIAELRAECQGGK